VVVKEIGRNILRLLLLPEAGKIEKFYFFAFQQSKEDLKISVSFWIILALLT